MKYVLDIGDLGESEHAMLDMDGAGDDVVTREECAAEVLRASQGMAWAGLLGGGLLGGALGFALGTVVGTWIGRRKSDK